jgi:hypothetical protein
MATLTWVGEKSKPVVYMTNCSTTNWTTIGYGPSSEEFCSRSWHSKFAIYLLHEKDEYMPSANQEDDIVPLVHETDDEGEGEYRVSSDDDDEVDCEV